MSAYTKVKPRLVREVIEPQPVVEGAGVHLKRSIATRRLDYVDPFLLFDHFGSSNPDDYLAGFPMHPHRGIETVTYILSGVVAHRDSLGNAGEIGAGDIQWMTAGSGIMHEEMPQMSPEPLNGFQLWVNLPARLKMSQPRYRDLTAAQIPEVRHPDGVVLRVVAGRVEAPPSSEPASTSDVLSRTSYIDGAVTDLYVDPVYIDVSVPAGVCFTHRIARGDNVFAYVFNGEGLFGLSEGKGGTKVGPPRLVLFEDGDHVEVCAPSEPVRFLLISGHPLHEPVARHGPFVMNTGQEIEQALHDLREGTFVRTRPKR